MSLAATTGVSEDDAQPVTGVDSLKLSVDVDNLRTSLPPPSELSPVRPMALYRNHTGRKGIGAQQRNPLTRKGSDPGLTAMFRSAATGGMPRTPPPPTRTPPPGVKRRELPKAQAPMAQRTTNRTIVIPSGLPTRFDIGKRPLFPLRLPTLMEIGQLHMMDEVERREEGQELTNELNSSAPKKKHSNPRQLVDGLLPSSSDVALSVSALGGGEPHPQSLLFSEAARLVSRDNRHDPRALSNPSSNPEASLSNTTACLNPRSASQHEKSEIPSQGFAVNHDVASAGFVRPNGFEDRPPNPVTTLSDQDDTYAGTTSFDEYRGAMLPSSPPEDHGGGLGDGDVGDFFVEPTAASASDEIRSQTDNRPNVPSLHLDPSSNTIHPLAPSSQLPPTTLQHADSLNEVDLPTKPLTMLLSPHYRHNSDLNATQPSSTSQRSASEDGDLPPPPGLSHSRAPSSVPRPDSRTGPCDDDDGDSARSGVHEISYSEAGMVTSFDFSTTQEVTSVRSREGDHQSSDKKQDSVPSINTRTGNTSDTNNTPSSPSSHSKPVPRTDHSPPPQLNWSLPADDSVPRTPPERQRLASVVDERPLIATQPSLSSLSGSVARSTSGTTPVASSSSIPPPQAAPRTTLTTTATHDDLELWPPASESVGTEDTFGAEDIGGPEERGEDLTMEIGQVTVAKPKPKAFYSTDIPGPSSLRQSNPTAVRHRANTTPAIHPYQLPRSHHALNGYDQPHVRNTYVSRPSSTTLGSYAAILDPRTTLQPREQQQVNDHESWQENHDEKGRRYETSHLSPGPPPPRTGSSLNQSSLNASMSSEASTSGGAGGSVGGRRPLPRPPGHHPLGGAGEASGSTSVGAPELPSSSQATVSTRSAGSSSQATVISSGSVNTVAQAGPSSSASTMMFSPVSPKSTGPRPGPSRTGSTRQVRPSPGLDNVLTSMGSASSSSQGSFDGQDAIAIPVVATSPRGTLPTPPSSANMNGFTTQSTLAPPGQARLPQPPPRVPPSPPPDLPRVKHASTNGDRNRRNVKIPARIHLSPQQGRMDTQGMPAPIPVHRIQGAKGMPMPLVLNSAILAPSSNAQPTSTAASFNTPGKSPGPSRTPSATRTPSSSRTPTTGTTAKTRSRRSDGEGWEDYGTTRCSSSAFSSESGTRAYVNIKPNVEKGSFLELKQQHVNPANVRSAPTSPRRFPLNIGVPHSPQMFFKPPANRSPGEPAKLRPSVTLNTSFAALSPPAPLTNNSQPASPVARVPLSRPLPVPGTAAGQAATPANPQAINPAAVRAFRALPSPSSVTPTANLPMQMPTPSSTTSTHVRPLPTTKSKSLDAGPSSSPNRPLASSSAHSASPKLPLSLSIPNAVAKPVIHAPSPRMLPTPLTSTKEKQKEQDFDPPSILSGEQSLSRVPRRVPRTVEPYSYVTAAELSPDSGASTSDPEASGTEGLHTHPDFGDWSNGTESDLESIRLDIEDEIVFRDREEIEDEDESYIDTILDPNSLRIRLDEVQEHQTRLGTSTTTLNKEFAGWRHTISSPSDGNPISPIVVGKSTFNDRDEALSGDSRHRHRQRMIDHEESDTDLDDGRVYTYDAYGDHPLSRSPSPIRYARPDSRGRLRLSSSGEGQSLPPARPSRSPSPPASARSSRSTSRSSSSLSFVSGDPHRDPNEDLELGFNLRDDGGRLVRRRKEQPRSYRHSYRAPTVVDTELGSSDGHRSLLRSALGTNGHLGGQGGSASTLGSREEDKKSRSGKRSTIKEVKDAVSRAFDFDARDGDKKSEKKDSKEDVATKRMKARGGVVDISTPEIPAYKPKVKGKKSQLSNSSRPGTAESSNTKSSSFWKSTTSPDKTIPIPPFTPASTDSNTSFMWVSRRKPFVPSPDASPPDDPPVDDPLSFLAPHSAIDRHRALLGAFEGDNSPELGDEPGIDPVAVQQEHLEEIRRTKKQNASASTTESGAEPTPTYSGPFSDSGHGSQLDHGSSEDEENVDSKSSKTLLPALR
ncbi:hypothetical protein BKA70DRAFT_1278995 [Coprinopsis sp. MPI-PUGE-AT-0042]|nr:hypothetical protein BKA70DRAFT_1278995 [Coprinopsis sp. MPI-PUGE-AT-0042]